MKKTISISITGVESAKMQKLQKANAAIRTLREFAQEIKRETETSVLGVSAVAEPGNEPEAGEDTPVHYPGPCKQKTERKTGKRRGRANVYPYRPGFARCNCI